MRISSLLISRTDIHFWKWLLAWTIQKHVVITINHDAKLILCFLETKDNLGSASPLGKKKKKVQEQAGLNLKIVFITACILSTTYQLCVPPTTWSIPPTKYICRITNVLGKLSCPCVGLGYFPPALQSLGVETIVLQRSFQPK